MRRWTTFAAVALTLAFSASAAHAIGVGIAGFGGISFPILQDDVAQGTQFGVRVPVKLVPLFTVEPYYASSALGDKSEDFAGLSYTRDGGTMSSFGANVLLTTGGPVSFYPFVGIGSQKWTREGSSDLNDTAWNFGLGIGFTPMPSFGIDVRGELNMMTTGDTSRKYGNATVGLSYHLPF